MFNELLKTKEDQIGYVKMILRQAISDGELGAREAACERVLIKAAGISDEIFKEAEHEFLEGKKDLPQMNKPAVVAGIMASLDISMSDMEFSQEEVQNVIQLGTEAGVTHNDDLREHLRTYCKKFLAVTNEIEKLLDEIKDIGAIPLDQIFPTMEDKKGFVKLLMKIATSDNEVAATETFYIVNVANSFKIDNATVEEAMKEFKTGDHSYSFTTEDAKIAIFKCAVRVAGIDSNFDDKEKELIKELADEFGIPCESATIDRIAQLAKEKHEVYALKEEAIKFWLSL